MRTFVSTVVALLAAACTLPTQPTPVPNQQTQTVVVNVGTPGASPSPGICEPSTKVNISAPATLPAGQAARIDATPVTNGHGRNSDCDVADGISWGVAGPCSLSSTSEFNPLLTCNAPGTCALTAVSKASRGDATVTCTAAAR